MPPGTPTSGRHNHLEVQDTYNPTYNPTYKPPRSPKIIAVVISTHEPASRDAKNRAPTPSSKPVSMNTTHQNADRQAAADQVQVPKEPNTPVEKQSSVP